MMKKRILVIILAFLSSFLFAQKKNADQIASIEICYGYKTLNQNFQNNLNTIGNFKFNKPLQTIGILLNSQLAYAARGHASGNVYCNQIIPQAIILNGINKCNVTGFNFGASLGRDLCRKVKNFDLMLNIGFNTGRLRLTGDELTRQKNPYFAPKIALQPIVKNRQVRNIANYRV